ncbi:hypothetical protein [Pseudofrankia inefficax]|uniref:SNF2 superfamily protein n=1 Tax=Pseudofrankia inefficax (strain DSM 45817 / CECT 9037 / DDB 130130 / EuI1c) TaxID=298654 RepID=E3J747_PSEI1|nr:hypothetical protein [Pseudofrankia inefficax]ADP84411.1 SNF2 superfamily protein [Pseudofrankia inefficax]
MAFDYKLLTDPAALAAARQQATADVAAHVLARSEPLGGLEAGAVLAKLQVHGALVDGGVAALARRAAEAADPAMVARRDEQGRFIAEAAAKAAATNGAAARATSESWAEGRRAAAELGELNRTATPRPGLGFTGS